MTPEQTELLQWVVSLPLQAVLLIAVINLWKAYVAAQNARVDDLKLSYEKNLADLRTRVMLLEDRAGIHYQNAAISSQKAVSGDFDAKRHERDYGE